MLANGGNLKAAAVSFRFIQKITILQVTNVILGTCLASFFLCVLGIFQESNESLLFKNDLKNTISLSLKLEALL